MIVPGRKGLRGLAGIALQCGETTEALRLHHELIKKGHRTPELLYNTGLLYQKSGQLDEAARLYRDALAENPEFPEALLNLGHVLKSMGQEQEARICWSKALEARPELAHGYFETAK